MSNALILIAGAIQAVCLLVIFLAIVVFPIDDWWQNNHFVDDKGRRYKRTKDGFKYY